MNRLGADDEPALRLVALGASNLVRALPDVVTTVADAADGPVDVLAACGNGRSYGLRSRYAVVRTLPGIAGCGLWPALEARPPMPTVALVTDIGNDVAYGVPVPRIVDWVETSARRLRRLDARLVITLPALEVIEQLPAWQFRAVSLLLFPGRGLEHRRIVRDVRVLADALVALGARYDATVVSLPPTWFGIDPIHWNAQGRRAVLGACLASWGIDTDPRTSSWPRRLSIRTAQAEETGWLHYRRRVSQPARRLDAASLSLF